jgi:general secretion pathway protein D
MGDVTRWQTSRLIRGGIVVLQTWLVASCSGVHKQFGAADDTPSEAVTAVRKADLSVRPTASTDDPNDRQSNEPLKPLLFPGSEPESPVPASRAPNSGRSGMHVASLEPVAIRGDGVEINFEGADIPSVAKVLLGDLLHLNFAVDPKVQGTVTLASVGPIPRKDVLPTFESALRMQNAAIVRDGKFMKIVPIPDAAGYSSVSGVGEPGFGVSIVPLHYISAATVAKTAENMLARQGAIRVDQARNLLLIQGTASEREAALDMISTFDVEWLRNQSVGVYPLKSTSPETMIEELERVFENGDGGPGQGVIHFQPISRMNAVMVVTKNPNLLNQTTQWVDRLDRSDASSTMLRSYRLKYGNATQIAKILNNIFGSNRSGSDAKTSPTAPGTTTAQSRLDSLDRSGSQSGSASGSTNGQSSQAGQSGGGAFGSASRAGGPISASFETFSGRNNSDDSSGDASSGGGASQGRFQNIRITADTVNNAIVIYANQEDYRIVERAVRDFDRPKLQVAIEATVAEVTLTKELSYGVQFFLNGLDAGAGNSGSLGFFNAVTAAAQTTVLQQTAPGFNLLLGSAQQPHLILNALNSITDVKVLSSPLVVALDNQPALLEVGNEIPITTSSATILSNSNTPTVNTIEMRNTGVILKVLPHVNSNGTIELEVDQEVSALVNPNQQTLTPTISQRRVHSTVAVSSGQTVLLGGLISENDQKTKSTIPVLDEIKFLGDFMGNTDNTKTRSEIIIFIKPQLIRNSVDARSVTQEFRDRLTSMKKDARSVVKGADAASSANNATSSSKP